MNAKDILDIYKERYINTEEIEAIFIIDLNSKKYAKYIRAEIHKEIEDNILSLITGGASIFENRTLELMTMEIEFGHILLKRLGREEYSGHITVLIANRDMKLGKLLTISKNI